MVRGLAPTMAPMHTSGADRIVETIYGAVTITEARGHDVEAYVNLHIELLNVTYAPLFDSDFAPARRAEFDERCSALRQEISDTGEASVVGRDPYRRHLVAKSRCGTLVGVAAAGNGVDEWEHEIIGDIWRPPATQWCIDHLYLVPGLHGTGVAQAMLELLLPHGHGYLWVFQANHRAVRFYERNGFAADGLSASSGPTWGNQMMDRMVRLPAI